MTFSPLSLLDPVVFTSLIHGWCKNKNINKAMHLLDEMGKMGFVPDVVTWTTLIGGFCRAGRSLAEKELFFNMHKHGQVPNIRKN